MAYVTDRRWATSRATGKRVATGYAGPKPWQACWKDPVTAKERTRSFGRKLDAERFLTTVEHDKLVGSYVDPRAGLASFASVADGWLATVAHLKPSTVAGYESILNRHLTPRFGRTPVASIDTTAVRSFVAAMFSDGAGYQTVRNALNVLRAVLASAVESRLLAANPADGVRLPRARAKQARQKRNAERVFLTAAQVAVLAEAMPAPYGVVVWFAAYTGVRAGELAALRVDDLDLTAGTVTVCRSVAEVHGELVEGSTKSGEARVVTLPAFLVAMLREHLAASGRRGSAPLFVAERGGPLRQSNFYRRIFKPVVRGTEGVPDAMRFHDLRHTHAALLIAEGAHPKAVQERLGHASIDITMDVYGHLYESVDAALAEALDGLASRTAADLPRTTRGLRAI